MRVYLSHSIRGKKGNAATQTEQKVCCDIAVALGEQLCAEIKSLELYVPGGPGEEFVSIAYRKKYITEKQILDVDCAIIDNCEAMIVYVPTWDELQGGRLIEFTHAVDTDKPVLVFNEHEIDIVIGYLTHMIVRGA